VTKKPPDFKGINLPLQCKGAEARGNSTTDKQVCG